MIASRKLRTGDRLPSERDVAEQLGISRNSVRLAIRSLTDSGLLSVKKGMSGGAFVQGGSASAVRASFADLYSLGTLQPAHLTEARLMIGVEVVRLACQRATDNDLDVLEANILEAEKAVRAGDLERRSILNTEFFGLLARMTRNPALEIMMDAVMEITVKFAVRPSNRDVMPFRRSLLKDLRARDANASEKRMRQYLEKLQKIYLSGLVSQPGDERD